MNFVVLLLVLLELECHARRVQSNTWPLQGVLYDRNNATEPSNPLAVLLSFNPVPLNLVAQKKPLTLIDHAYLGTRNYFNYSASSMQQQAKRTNEMSMSIAERREGNDGAQRGSKLRDIYGLFVLILPTVATWLAAPVLSMVDAAVIGRASAASSGGVDLAALGAAVLACDYPGYVLTAALSTTTTVLTAKELSKRGKKASQAIARTGLLIGGIVGLLFGVTMFLSMNPILRLIIPTCNHGQLLASAATYARIRMLAAPFMIIETVLQAWFLGRKDAITPLLVTVLAAVVNLVLDIALCFGCNMGLAGAAWATSFSQIIACAAIGWYYRKVSMRDVSEEPEKDDSQPCANNALTRDFCSMSIPTAGVVFTKVCVYGGTAAAAQQLGVISGAADVLMSNIFFFFAVFGDAVSSVAQSAMPAHLPPTGSSGAAKRWAMLIAACGLCVGLLNSGLSAVLATVGAGIFTKEFAVLQGMRKITPIMAGALLLHAFSMSSEGILFASQRMNFMSVSYALNAGLALMSLYADVQNGLTLTGIWLIKIQFQLVRILLNGGLILSPWSPLREKAHGGANGMNSSASPAL